MTPEDALDKIVGNLSNYNYHNLLEEIQIVRQAVRKSKIKTPRDTWGDKAGTGIFSDDY